MVKHFLGLAFKRIISSLAQEKVLMVDGFYMRATLALNVLTRII